MKPEEVFKRYDIRGNYPEEIDEEFAEILGKAFGTFVNQNNCSKVIVTKDTKDSSEELKDKLVKGLKSSGVTVLYAGVGPTDFAALVGMENSAFSVQVTSSHLAINTNGFKFMYPEGNSLVNEDLYRLQDIFMQREFLERKGSVEDVSEASKDLYRGEVRKFLSDNGLEPEKNAYLETMSGAGLIFLPGLLENYSVKVEHSDQNYNPPNPDSHSFEELKNSVDSGESEIGVVTDMDADRARVYYNGEWLDGTTVMAVLSEVIAPDKLVASVDTAEQVEGYFDGAIEYTRVGDPFVLEKMLEESAGLSGEPNNHFAFSDFVPYNSGTLTALILASADIDSVLEELPDREELRESIEVEDKNKVMENVREYAEEKGELMSEKDGIKFSVDNSNVLVRKSGTSQKIRVVIDAPDENQARKIFKDLETIIINQ